MKYIFSIFILFCAFPSFAQTAGHDTLVVSHSGNFGTQSYFLSPKGDTLFLKNFPILTATSNLDFPNTPGHTTNTLTVNVPGAVAGDAVAVGIPVAANLVGLLYAARVSAAGVVSVTLFNTTTGPKNPPGGAFKIRVIQ